MNKMILGSMLLILASSTFAANIKLSVGLSLPPYIIKAEDRGIELDIIRRALKGHTVKVLYMPFSRAMTAIKDGSADATATINESSGVKCNYSDTHITYQNVAVSLKSKGLTINTIGDMKNLRIVAFQNATKYLGKEYAAMANSNTKYAEKARQEKQNMMLFSGKVDAVVGDINIFKFYNKKVAGKVDVSQPFTVHEVFPKTQYKVCFKDAALQAAFNKGLKTLKSSGEYNKILQKYVK